MGKGLAAFTARDRGCGRPGGRDRDSRGAGVTARRLLLAALLTSLSWSGTGAQGRTGLRVPTAQERRWEAANLARTRSVGPNALALRRSRGAGRAPALPTSVDNSLLPSFPPVRDQGALGSCVDFAVTYYTMTHMVAMARGWDTRSDAVGTRAFSPKWTYNLCNGGEDGGSWITAAYQVLLDHGAATWAQFPYDSDYRSWCLDPGVWQAAISHRMERAGCIDGVSTDAGLRDLKQLLANGYVLNLGTSIGGWHFRRLGDDPGTPDDDALAGKDVCSRVLASSLLHAMTVVGYDDAAWVDLNGNKAVDEGEKGALRVVNSWGAGWKEGGFTWIAYDALRSRSAVAGASVAGRVSAFLDDRAYWIAPRQDYGPRLVARFIVSHARRGQMAVSAGVSDLGALRPGALWSPAAFRFAGGPYAFDGSTARCDGTFVLDLTDLLADDGWQRWYLLLSDDAAGDPAILRSLRVTNPPTASAESRAVNVPRVADGSEALSWVDASLSGGVPPPGSAVPEHTGEMRVASSWADDTGTVGAFLTGAPDAADAGDKRNLAIESPVGSRLNLAAPGVSVTYSAADRCIRAAGLALKAGEAYRVVLRGIRGGSGPPIVEDGTANVSGGTVADATPPSFAGVAATDRGVVSILFSEGMDPSIASDRSRYSVSGPDGSPADLAAPGVSLSHDALRKLTTIAGLHLPAGTLCVVTGHRLEDAAGNRMVEEGGASVRRVIVADVTPPTAACSAVNTEVVVVRFSEPVQPGDATSAASFGIESPVGTPAAPSPVGVSLRYEPTECAVTIAGLALRRGDSYRLWVRGVRDLAGNALVESAEGGGRTGTVAERMPPVVTRVEPAAGTEGVLRTGVVRVEFNRPMDEASVIRSLSLCRRRTGEAVGATVAASGHVFTLTPTAPLAAGDEYVVTLLGSAADTAGITLDGDQDGQAEGSPTDDVVWVFTTQPAPDVPILLAPEDGAVVSPVPEFRVACTAGTSRSLTVRLEVRSGRATRTFEAEALSGRTEIVIPWDGTQPALPGKWSWRAQTIDAAGHLGEWSAQRTFEVTPVPPAVPAGIATFGPAVAARAGTLRDLGIQGARVAAWDAARQQYCVQDEGVPLILGKGYWLQVARSTVPRFTGKAAIGPWALPLKSGWNLISVPFLQPVAWSLDGLTVRRGPETRTLRDAHAAGWVSDYALGWEQEDGGPQSGRYRVTYDATRVPGVDGLLLPWRAYWVYAYQECELNLPDPAQALRVRSRRGRPGAPGDDVWAVHLRVRRAARVDEVLVGISREGAAAVGAPPPPTGDPCLRIRSQRGPTPLAMDLRRAGTGRQEWLLALDAGEAAAGEAVTLSWPDLRVLPASVSLILEDPATHTRRDLRTTGAYSFAADGATRLLRLIAEPRASGAAGISGLALAPLRGGSCSVRFALSSAAVVDIDLAAPNGRTVAVLARGRTATPGLNTVPCRADVSPGIYLLRAAVTTEGGRRALAVQPVVLSR